MGISLTLEQGSRAALAGWQRGFLLPAALQVPLTGTHCLRLFLGQRLRDSALQSLMLLILIFETQVGVGVELPCATRRLVA